MYHPIRRTLSTAVASSGIAASAVGLAPVAMASPVSQVSVPCDTTALTSAISSAASGETLELAHRCVYSLQGSLPDVSRDLTIVGRGATLRNTDKTGPGFAILSVGSGVTLNISDLNFTGGGGDNSGACSGAIQNNGGHLTIQGGTFADNGIGANGTCEQSAGAIYNGENGYLQVSGATFSKNYSFAPGVNGPAGGAIINEGYADISLSEFVGNDATFRGGAIFSNFGGLTVLDCKFTGNESALGGALSGRDIAVVDSTFTSNRASDVGGAIYASQVTVAGSQFTGNDAPVGGAIGNHSQLSVADSKFTGNQASDVGGAIAIAELGGVTLFGDKLSGNRAGDGGAIYEYGDVPGVLNVISTSITGNVATGPGGQGAGGIYNGRGPVYLHHAIIRSNTPKNCYNVPGCTS